MRYRYIEYSTTTTRQRDNHNNLTRNAVYSRGGTEFTIDCFNRLIGINRMNVFVGKTDDTNAAMRCSADSKM